MSFNNAVVTVSSTESRDDELFTSPSCDPTPDRHPSILRPGGHASPLKYPAVLRPGAARRSRTPSPKGIATPPAPPPQHISSPPVSYKAYSPPRPQSPSDELSAEIEGYFTALEVPPLSIKKPQSPQPATRTGPLEERCVSPPVPPKERIPVEIERYVVSPMSELEAPTGAVEEDHHIISPLSEPDLHAGEAGGCSELPPAYDESQRVTPLPEKAAPPHPPSDESLAGAAASSAAQVGGAVAGVDVDEAIAASATDATAVTIGTPDVTVEAHSENNNSGNGEDAPPPLPPRPSPSAAGKGKEPAMPGAFPAPPTRPISPSYKASGAAATSAASVGAAVAGVGQSAGLKQARKALEKRIGNMIDKAKEHHHAREQYGHERKASGKTSLEGVKKKRATGSVPVAEVRLMKP